MKEVRHRLEILYGIIIGITIATLFGGLIRHEQILLAGNEPETTQAKSDFRSEAWEASYFNIAPLAGRLEIQDGYMGKFDKHATESFDLLNSSRIVVRIWASDDNSYTAVPIKDDGNGGSYFCVPKGMSKEKYHADIHDPQSKNTQLKPAFVIEVLDRSNGGPSCPP